jgi:hypothetical protein
MRIKGSNFEQRDVVIMSNIPNTEEVPNRMHLWEARFKHETGLVNRSQYKIYYCRVAPAPILILGINPGGDPLDVMPNGVDRVGKGPPHAASAAYYEGNEHDLLDCNWRQTGQLIALLTHLLDGDDKEEIRSKVVMTNMAFRRARKSSEIDVPKAMDESAAVLAEIIDLVAPSVILLVGAKINEFTSRYCDAYEELNERHSDVNQVVFWPWSVRRKGQTSSILAVQVASYAQFGWTYEKYDIAERIRSFQRVDR